MASRSQITATRSAAQQHTCSTTFTGFSHWIHKIQDYFIISFKKLKRGWTLTTLQYTVPHIVYFRNQRTVVENTKVTYIKQTSNLHNLHTHTHTHILLWCLNRFICSEMILTADLTVLDFGMQNHLPVTRWKNLITFSKDMAVVIHNHPNFPYHTTFIQLT